MTIQTKDTILFHGELYVPEGTLLRELCRDNFHHPEGISHQRDISSCWDGYVLHASVQEDGLLYLDWAQLYDKHLKAWCFSPESPPELQERCPATRDWTARHFEPNLQSRIHLCGLALQVRQQKGAQEGRLFWLLFDLQGRASLADQFGNALS